MGRSSAQVHDIHLDPFLRYDSLRVLHSDCTRLTIYLAIGTIIAAAAIGDMVLYNRRKRREWMSQKLDEEARETAAAFQAFKEGTANEDQILLINRERQKVEAAEAKRNSKGIIGRSIAFVTSPLSKEEKPVFGASTEDSEQGAGEGLGIVKAVEEVRSQRQDEHRIPSLTEDHPERSQLGSRGGPLDQLGAEAAAAASETKQSWANRWTSWISGR